MSLPLINAHRNMHSYHTRKLFCVFEGDALRLVSIAIFLNVAIFRREMFKTITSTGSLTRNWERYFLEVIFTIYIYWYITNCFRGLLRSWEHIQIVKAVRVFREISNLTGVNSIASQDSKKHIIKNCFLFLYYCENNFTSGRSMV